MSAAADEARFMLDSAQSVDVDIAMARALVGIGYAVLAVAEAPAPRPGSWIRDADDKPGDSGAPLAEDAEVIGFATWWAEVCAQSERCLREPGGPEAYLEAYRAGATPAAAIAASWEAAAAAGEAS